MADMMTFPNTWEEYEQFYGITDTEEIYTNGARLIPSFRVRQWLDHIAQTERKTGEWVDDGLDAIGAMGIEYRWQKCSNCGNTISKAPMQRFPNFCSHCGAKMSRGEGE